MSKLNRINHNYKARLWCGIAALATVTGRPTSECRDAIVSVRDYQYGTPRVTGVSNGELIKAFALLGFDATFARDYATKQMKARPTLAAMLKGRSAEERAEVMVVNVTGHYVTVTGRQFIDTFQTEPVSLSEAHCRRARVRAAWIVRRSDRASAWTPPVKPQRTKSSYRPKAFALAAQHGIEIDISDWRSVGHIWVTCQRLEDAGNDPFDGDHIVFDWEEALERVQGYVEALQS